MIEPYSSEEALDAIARWSYLEKEQAALRWQAERLHQEQWEISRRLILTHNQTPYNKWVSR